MFLLDYGDKDLMDGRISETVLAFEREGVVDADTVSK